MYFWTYQLPSQFAESHFANWNSAIRRQWLGNSIRWIGIRWNGPELYIMLLCGCCIFWQVDLCFDLCAVFCFQCKDDWQEGGNQERGHVGGHAAGCSGLRHPSAGEVQHREGHCGLHQEGVWQEIQPDMALHRWPQLWQLCYTRDEAFHLLLPRTSRHSAVQVRLNC